MPLPPALAGKHAWARDLALVYVIPALIINFGNAAAYLFQVLLGRSLSVEAFGSFNALFSAILILTAPASFLPLIVAQSAMTLGGDPAAERTLLQKFLLFASIGAALLCAMGLVLAVLFGRRLDIGLSTGLAALVTIVGSCLHPIVVGLLQARRRYLEAALVVGANSLLRLMFGFLLVAALALGTAGAMWSVALPVITAFLLGLAFLADLLRNRGTPLPDAVNLLLRRASWRQAATVTLLAAISNLDVVMAQLILPAEAAGLYAGAAVVSRIAILLPSALSTIIFTESARHHTGEGSRMPWSGIALTGLLAGFIGLLFVAAGEIVMVLLLGAEFAPAGDLLRITGIAMGLLSVSQAVAMSLAGRGDFSCIGVMALGLAALAILPPIFKLDAAGLALLTLVINCGLLAACLGIALGNSRRA